MAYGADLLLNRNARALGAGSALREALLREAERSRVRVHETRDVEELAAVALGIARRGTDTVILAGGDGSCMMGLTALARAFGKAPLPPVAIAPAGTVCTIAKNLGVAGRRAAERTVRAVGEHEVGTMRFPTLRIRDDGGNDRVGFAVGSGLVARFFEVYDGAPSQGLVVAAGIAARVFVGSLVGSAFSRRVLEPTPCLLTVNGRRHPSEAFSLVVASVFRDVGLHLLVTYRAGMDPQRFHVVASGLSPGALGRQMPRVIAGRPLRGEPHVDELASSFRIDFGDRPDAYVIDGDVFSARWVEVGCGPLLTLRFAQGRGSRGSVSRHPNRSSIQRPQWPSALDGE